MLTTARLAPHLSHRPLIQQVNPGLPVDLENLEQFDYILLNTRFPGTPEEGEIVNQIIAFLAVTPQFQVQFEQDGVVILQQVPVGEQ